MTTTQHSATRSKTSEFAPRLRFNLSRNLAALQQHRPKVFQAIAAVDADSSSRYRIEPVAGKAALFRQGNDGAMACISAIHNGRLVTDPVAPYRQALSSLTGKALCGIGDGAILDWLARHAPNDPSSLVSGAGTVYLIEPDVELLLSCMMLRDLTGAIEQKRFHWFVGSDWQEDAAHTLLEEPLLVDGLCVIGQGPCAATITAYWKQLMAQRRERFAADCASAATFASTFNRAEVAALFGPHPPRQPRVLLMTSQHTTVLQHSTRDAADAFAELGWDAKLLVEREAHHVVGETAVLRAIAQFKPDLIFTIDHLRSELPHVPREIPFICWIQDNLPNLTSKQAGQRIGIRDYIIGGWVDSYVLHHSYPPRQCIATRRMTRPVSTVHQPKQRVEDVVYVSNHSDLPHDRLQRMVRERPLPPGVDAALLRAAGQRMIELYDEDVFFFEKLQTAHVVQDISSSTGRELTEQQVNDAASFLDDLRFMLHRQQALRWAVDIIQQQGLSLGLYGSGWEQHPRFGPYARGVVSYGQDLQALTQHARINLQLEPFNPTQHQRLLDGLAAGGFFLCRYRHPLELLHRRMLKFIDAIDPSIATEQQAQDMLDEAQLAEMRLISQQWVTARPQHRGSDLIAHLRSDGMRYLLAAMRVAPLPPRYEQVAFVDPADFAQKMQRFVNDESLRRAIAAEQRAFVESHFTYTANLRDTTDIIGKLIADEC